MNQDDIQTLSNSGNVSIHSGFPNPATSRANQGRKLALDLNQLLISHPSSTYLFRAKGHGAEADGVYDGDVALIDRSLSPRPEDLVLAWQNSGFVFCRYSRLGESDTLWGVVSATIHPRRGAV